MNRTTVALAISIALSPIAALAQSTSGPYISVAAGINKMQHEDVNLSVDGIPGSTVSGEVLTKTGPAFSIAAGTRVLTHWRTEVEGSYRSDEISGELGLVGQQNAKGTETKYGVMANAIYDFTVAGLHPYLGAGVGAQFVKTTSLHGTNGVRTISVEGDTQSSPAYQGIVGLAFPTRTTRGMTVTIEYRYMALTGERTYKGLATIPGVGSFPMTDVSKDNRNHSVLVGLRFPFGG
jgi:opacity protein-like surface antigen